jgi:hypothetical protein
MPTVRKLAPDEAQAIKDKGKSSRKLAQEAYDRMLADFEVGDYEEV